MQSHTHRSFHITLLITTLAFLLAAGLSATAQNGHTTAMHTTAMHGSQASHNGPSKVVDIVSDPADVPDPINRRMANIVKVTLTAKEVVGQLDHSSGTQYRYWTFNGKVPAPLIRVRQGDTVEVTLKNDPDSHMAHSVDFHAALGPGGGAAFSEAAPGQSKTFSFVATTPGLFVYHCGTPMIAEHIANGMYGLILVEPPDGLARVDHEYYVMQGEVYTTKPKGAPGMQQFSAAKLMQELPEYFVFNGAVDALTSTHPLKAKTGETLRIFFGDAGPNRPSSLHVVGEMFTKEYVAGSLNTAPRTGIQTAFVAPGSAALLELKTITAGKFNFMDHAMSRMAKGLMGTIEVSGQTNASLMHAGPATQGATEAASVMGITPADAAAATTTGSIAESNEPAAAATPMSAMEDMPGRAQPSAKKNRKPSSPTLKQSSALSGLLSSSPTEMAGCLHYERDSVTLKAWPSGRTYRLQARPLLFAQLANQLVYLKGHIGSVIPDKPSTADDPSFVVDSGEQLQPNCTAQVTPALLRIVAGKEADSPTAAPAVKGGVTVGMSDMAFTKKTITIKAGQTVVWKNTSQTMHNVVDDASKALNQADVQLPAKVKPFGSGLLQSGQIFSHTFATPGTYRYVCTLHEGMGMKGEVIVK